MAMSLIDDVRISWKYWSVQIPVVTATAMTVYMSLPPETAALIPKSWVDTLMTVSAIVTACSRVVKQNPTPPAPGATTGA
jgi:hypothetical protein